MAKIAIIGTGMMGSGLTEAALKRGDSVTVWNRTIERARPLEKLGAVVAPTLKEAVQGAERVHIILSDDAAVDAALSQLAPGLAPNAIVIDHTTVSPAGTKARFSWCDERHISFLHAPVFMAPQSCRDATGLMLCAGPAARFEQVRPALERMTGQVWYVGERRDLAAAYKLFGNSMILTIVGGLSDVFEMGASLGVDARDALSLFSRFKPAGTIDLRGARMADLNFGASFELTMARKDLRLMLEAAGSEAALTVLPGLAKRMDECLALGLGQQDVAVIAKDGVERSRQTSELAKESR